MTTRLIVNADDYGHTAGVSAGIRKSHLDGIVTTTTTMMNYADALAAISEARATCPKLALGVHLVATEGAPLLARDQVPTLVRDDGDFYSSAQLDLMVNGVDHDQLYAEWKTQIELFLSTGATIDHLDSHHHAAFRGAVTLQVLAELAAEYRVPVRVPFSATDLADSGFRAMVDRLLPHLRYPQSGMINGFYDDGATLENLLAIFEDLPDDTVELMVHPGITDDEIVRISSYSFPREREMGILTDPRIRAALDAQGVELITFAQL